MKKTYLFIVLLFLLFFELFSQTQQDCPGANPICNSSYTYGSSFSGGGSFPSEVSTSSCLGTGETNTVWFVFTAQSTGQVGFVISQPGTDPTDYDWAVYDITGVGCSGSTIPNGNMVSCNYSATTGNTGPDGSTGLTNAGPSDSPFNSYINATNGNNYAIVIDNYTGNSVGFTVNFGASPTSIVDNTDPSFLSVTTPPCGATSLTFAFSENILCSSVQTSDFTLTGPGGPYTITGITCNNGSTQSVTFTATVSPTITASGSYSLNLVGAVTDLCGNVTPGASKPFSVTNAANASWSAPGTQCTNSPSVNLTALVTGTAGGTWSGTGVSGTNFNPSTAGAGVHNVTYSVTVGGCTDDITQAITVNAVPNATINAAGPFCTTSAAVNLTAATGGGTWSGTGITNAAAGTFDPATAGVGTHTITYSITSGGCTGSDTETITVNSTSNATITSAGPFCTSDPATNLSAATGGGTWSGTGITNGATGTFDPSTSGAGSHTITYTIGGSCGGTDTETITVNATPNATITAAGPFCTSDAATNLSAATGGGTWNGTGITNSVSGTFDPSTAGVGTHTISYSVTSGGCSGTDTETITVNSATNATITAAGPFCSSDPSTNLSAASGGGTWSGTGITNTASGTFDPLTAGAGSHTITYTIGGSCGSSDTETITVNSTPNATITTTGPFCTADAAANLNAATVGGTWSGTGITNPGAGTFDPNTAGAGTHTITYTVTINGCTGTDTETITVNSTPNATITSAGPFCTSDAATNLSAATGGGTWSGTGITNSGLGTFNPGTAGAGSHTINYSVSSGGCSSSDSEIITVNANPDATINPVGALCPGDAPVSLSAATGGGTFTGTGVSGNTFDPSVAGAGTHTITYSITVNGCSSTDTETINVNSSSDATITAVPALCTGDSPVTLTAATGGGTFSGTGVSGNSFSPSTAGAGTHTVTYTIGGSCGSTDNETITVSLTPDATITAAGPFCTADLPFNLSAATIGGTWSGTGITNNSSGTFDPSVAGAGTHTITYSVTTGSCTGTDSEILTVNSTPDATISASGPFCTTDPSTNLTAASGGGTWSGTGITNSLSGTFDPVTAGAGTHSITYSVTSSGCTGTDTESIIVNTTPDATITPVGALCPGDSPVTLNAATGGGTFSGTGVSGNTFNPSIAGVGTHIISYSVTANGCTSSDSETITVNNSTDPTINAQTPLCTGDSPVSLTAATGGGVWSGTGVVGSAFDPALAGSGIHTVTYTISGSCGSSDTETITVTANPDATITPLSSMCTGDAPVTLSAATPGGTFSGTGVSGNTFDPSLSGSGTFTISYDVTNGGCTSNDTETITVNSNSDATITPSGPFCAGDSPSNLVAVSAGGIWTGVGVSGSAFDPSISGAGTFTITYTISGSCGDSDSVSITVNPNTDATINSAGPFCSSDSPSNLSAANTGGIWSGNGITNPGSGTFNPSVAGVGTHLITYSISGSCGSIDTVFILVNSQSDATITPVGTLCSNDNPVTLIAAQNGGVWSGTGVTGVTFDPSISGSGIFEITYSIGGACGNTDVDSVIVNQSSDATINSAGPYCENDSPINLTSVQSGGIWSGNGITNSASGTFNPSVSGVGSHLITYTINGTCGDINTILIDVSPNADATITTLDSACTSGGLITLSAAQNGGVWSGTGVSGNTFDPSVAGAGIHTVTYTISGVCGDSDTEDIIVNASANATINSVNPVCVNSSPFNLTAMQSGGIWSGNGITDQSSGTFNPAVSGAGTHMITYTINGTCGNFDTILVIVNPPADATITSVGPYCDNILSVSLNANDNTGFWTGPGVTGSQFFPNSLSPGNYWIVYTIPGNCGDIDSVNIQVIGTPDATILNNPSPVCDSTAVFNLSSVDPGGAWTGTGITNPSSGTFDPSVSGGGSFTIIHVNTNLMCSDTDSITIVVGNVPPAPLATSRVICYSELPFTLSASGTGGQLTWLYTDSSGNILTLNNPDFIPAIPDSISDSTYYYCVMEQNGNCPSACTPVSLNVINVEASFSAPPDSGEIPFSVLFDSVSYLMNSNDIFHWDFGDGDTSNLFNPTHIYDEIGTYTVTLTATDSTGLCSSTFTMTIITKGTSNAEVPNIFTPNGDNVNDVFNLIHKNLISVEGIIYNRWGEMIYQWNSVESGWDGRTLSGTLAADGVYYYFINATGTDEPEPKKYEFRGYVTLAR